MSKSKRPYTVSEGDIMKRLTMIGAETQVTRELIKDNIVESSLMEEETFVNICEHYVTSYRLETLLFKIIDENHYDKKGAVYHVSDMQKTYLMVFIEAIHASKDALQEQNISLHLH